MFLYSIVTGGWEGSDLQYRRLIRLRSQVLRYIARPVESTIVWLSSVVHELAFIASSSNIRVAGDAE
jgi:hypothetical protein